MTHSLLLVESDRSTSDALTRILAEHGYQVVAARTTAEAMSRMEESLPEAVLADVHPYDPAPEYNGLWLAKNLRDSLGTHAPAIVLMTTSLELASEARRAGFRVLVKPMDLDAIFDSLRAELETK